MADRKITDGTNTTALQDTDVLPLGRPGDATARKVPWSAIVDQFPAADDDTAGKVELATDAEAQAKAATNRALVPSNLAALGASTTFAGLTEHATDAEAVAGAATDKALVPSNLPTAVPAHVPAATDGTAGKVELATAAETQTGTDATRAVTPAGLAASKPFIDIRKYGGVGDGVTDDALALAALVAANSSGVIYFPAIGGARTVYRLNSAVTVPNTFGLQFDPGAVLWVETSAEADIHFRLSHPVNVRWFGADSDAAATGAGCSINAGSDQLTVDAASWFKVGNGIYIPGAGAAGVNLFTRIKAINGLTFTLETAASTSVAGVRCLGDDSINFNHLIQTCFEVADPLYNRQIDILGTVQLCQPVKLNRGTCHLRGTHWFYANIYAPDPCSHAIQIGNDSGVSVGGTYEFTGLTFDIDAVNGIGIYSLNINQALIDTVFDHCWFQGGASQSATGIKALKTYSTVLTNCYFEFLKDGAWIGPTSGYISINNIDLYNNYRHGLHIEGDGSNSVHAVNINNVTGACDDTGPDAAIIYGLYADEINISNVSYDNNRTPTPDEYLLYGISLVVCDRVNLSNIVTKNCIGNNATYGSTLYIESCTHVKGRNIQAVSDAADRQTFGFVIKNCTDIDMGGFSVDGTLRNGVLCTGTQTDARFSNGHITNTGETNTALYAAFKASAGIIKLRDVYFYSPGAFSDYALDLADVADGGYFEAVDCDFNSISIADPATIPANPTGRTIIRDTRMGGGLAIFTANDATPSVALGLPLYKTNNSNPTTITMLDGGYSGQRVTVVITDAVTTVDFTGTNLKGNGGADWSPSADDSMDCVFDGTYWYCQISDNA